MTKTLLEKAMIEAARVAFLCAGITVAHSQPVPASSPSPLKRTVVAAPPMSAVPSAPGSAPAASAPAAKKKKVRPKKINMKDTNIE